jgi:hypothetical protein
VAEGSLTVEAAGSSTETDVIETRTSRLWLGEDGILRGVIKPDAEETLADAEANVSAAAKIADGRKFPLFIDMTRMMSATREARSYYGGEEPAKYSLAQALLVGSAVSRIIGNFFIRLNRTSFPTRLFTSEAEALEWLKGFME